MSSPVRSIPAATSAEAAWARMRADRIHHLVVLDGGSVAGVVSHRDLGGPRGAATRAERTVGDLMTTPVVTAPPDTTVRRAANLMRGRSIGCLVVVHGRTIAGIVTTADLLALLGRGGDRQFVAPKRWTLKHRVPHKRQPAGSGLW